MSEVPAVAWVGDPGYTDPPMMPSDAYFDTWLTLAGTMYRQGITSRYTPRQLRSLSGTLRLAAVDADSIRTMSLVPGRYWFLPAQRHQASERREASRRWLAYEQQLRDVADRAPSVTAAVTAFMQQTWDTYPDPLTDLEELTKLVAIGTGATYIEWQLRVESDLATFNRFITSSEQTIGWLIAAPTLALRGPPQSNAEINKLLTAVDAADRLIGGAIPDRSSGPSVGKAGRSLPEHTEMTTATARGLTEQPRTTSAQPSSRSGSSGRGSHPPGEAVSAPTGAAGSSPTGTSAPGTSAQGGAGPAAGGSPARDPEDPVAPAAAPGAGRSPRGGPGLRTGASTRPAAGSGAGGPLPHDHLLLPDTGWAPKDARHRVYQVNRRTRLPNFATTSKEWEIGCLMVFQKLLETGYGQHYDVRGSFGYTGHGHARRTSRPGQTTRGVIALMPGFGPKGGNRSVFDGVALVTPATETTRPDGTIAHDYDPSQAVIHVVEATRASYQGIGYKPGQPLFHLESAAQWVKAPNPRAVIYTIMTDRPMTTADAAHFAEVVATVERRFPNIDYYIVHRVIQQGQPIPARRP
jgi:hypothetical protein